MCFALCCCCSAGFGSGTTPYEGHFKCNSFAVAGACHPPLYLAKFDVIVLFFPGRPDLEFGDKVILPQEAFRTISALKLPYPLVFDVQNEKRKGAGVADKFGNVTQPPRQCCGVLEFSAPPEQAYLPYWMMQNLLIREGGRVVLKTAAKVQLWAESALPPLCGEVGMLLTTWLWCRFPKEHS